MITISVITPTFQREDLLARCVASVLAQQVTGMRIEHIVVNDAGLPLQHASWMDDPRVRVVETSRTERVFARNAGAALSRGDWLYFLDDDDYALPGAFQAMLTVACAQPNAVHLYGGYRIHNETTHAVETIRPALEGNAFAAMVAGEAFPPPASWVRRDAFFAAGGFDPLIVPGEDADLFRRLSLHGNVAGTPFIVTAARVAHPHTSTTDTSRQHTMWQRGTEKVLDLPQTLMRLLRETNKAPYWRGRCAREYAASAFREFRRGRFAAAAGRLSAFGRLSFRNPFSPLFWLGLRRREQSQIFHPLLWERPEALPVIAPVGLSESTVPPGAKTSAKIPKAGSLR
jgi:glycosyltransferase involved in cell wall biosynthesis